MATGGNRVLVATALSAVPAGETGVATGLGTFSRRGMFDSHVLVPTGKVTLERSGVGYKVHQTRVRMDSWL